MKIESSFKALMDTYNEHSRLQSWCFISASHGKSGSIARVHGKILSKLFMYYRHTISNEIERDWCKKLLFLKKDVRVVSGGVKHLPTNYYLVTQMLLNIDLPLYHSLAWT